MKKLTTFILTLLGLFFFNKVKCGIMIPPIQPPIIIPQFYNNVNSYSDNCNNFRPHFFSLENPLVAFYVVVNSIVILYCLMRFIYFVFNKNKIEWTDQWNVYCFTYKFEYSIGMKYVILTPIFIVNLVAILISLTALLIKF